MDSAPGYVRTTAVISFRRKKNRDAKSQLSDAKKLADGRAKSKRTKDFARRTKKESIAANAVLQGTKLSIRVESVGSKSCSSRVLVYQIRQAVATW